MVPIRGKRGQTSYLKVISRRNIFLFRIGLDSHPIIINRMVFKIISSDIFLLLDYMGSVALNAPVLVFFTPPKKYKDLNPIKYDMTSQSGILIFKNGIELNNVRTFILNQHDGFIKLKIRKLCDLETFILIIIPTSQELVLHSSIISIGLNQIKWSISTYLEVE